MRNPRDVIFPRSTDGHLAKSRTVKQHVTLAGVCARGMRRRFRAWNIRGPTGETTRGWSHKSSKL